MNKDLHRAFTYNYLYYDLCNINNDKIKNINSEIVEYINSIKNHCNFDFDIDLRKYNIFIHYGNIWLTDYRIPENTDILIFDKSYNQPIKKGFIPKM